MNSACCEKNEAAARCKVYFDGDFWGHHTRDHAGTPLLLEKRFRWNGCAGLIPAVYLTGKGLVIDVCIQAFAQSMQNFSYKLRRLTHDGTLELSEEQEMQLDAENPLTLHVSMQAVVNGTELDFSHSCALTWDPFAPADAREGEAWLEHYGLDKACGWSITRYAFPWKTKRKPYVASLSVTLIQDPIAVPGACFCTVDGTESFPFTHPINGTTHMLTVHDYERQDPEISDDADSWNYPTHCIAMHYTVCPPLPSGSLSVSDCSPGDKPRLRRAQEVSPEELLAHANAPLLFVMDTDRQGNLFSVYSSPHFLPVHTVEWRIVFHEKTQEDLRMDLL